MTIFFNVQMKSKAEQHHMEVKSTDDSRTKIETDQPKVSMSPAKDEHPMQVFLKHPLNLVFKITYKDRHFKQ